MGFIIWLIRRPYFPGVLYRLVTRPRQTIAEIKAYRRIYYDYEKRYHKK